MKLVDANILIYAVDRLSEQHPRSARWLAEALSSSETVLLPWVSLLAFVRITTHPRATRAPMEFDVALALVDDWLIRPNTVAPEPDARHAQRMTELLVGAGGRGGNLVTDAHLAALALQWGATVVTFDSDFGRFPGVRWESPA